MFGAKTINRHAALMNRMAETLGVDLSAAIAEGRLPAEAWREAVVRCTGCSDPEGCQHWLAEHAEPEAQTGAQTGTQTGTRTEVAPGYCRNKDLMQSLRLAVAES